MREIDVCEHEGALLITRSGVLSRCQQQPEANPSLAADALTLIRARPVRVCTAKTNSDCFQCTASQMVKVEVYDPPRHGY